METAASLPKLQAHLDGQVLEFGKDLSGFSQWWNWRAEDELLIKVFRSVTEGYPITVCTKTEIDEGSCKLYTFRANLVRPCPEVILVVCSA